MAEHQQPTLGAYYLVFVGLIALTGLTVLVSFAHLPPALHLTVGLAIATAKSLLVILIFMHVYYSTRLTWLVALASLFWLGLLIGLTLSDYLTRPWLSTGNPLGGRQTSAAEPKH
jgi:cytochrome c oxidase subunit 4